MTAEPRGFGALAADAPPDLDLVSSAFASLCRP